MPQPAPIERLVAAFSRLPGIGPRTAQRLTYHVLRRPDEEARLLAHALIEVKERIGECRVCFDLAEGDLCPICLDARRDDEVLCGVAREKRNGVDDTPLPDAIDAADALRPYLLTRYWLAFVDLFRDPIRWRDVLNGVLAQLAYVLVFLSAAWANFATKDINS